MQRLGHAVRHDGDGAAGQRKVDGPEILRRIETYGVTLLCAPAVVAAILDAAAADGEIPGKGTVRPVVAGACRPPARSSGSRLSPGGVHPDLWPHRDGAALTINRSRQEGRLPGRTGVEVEPSGCAAVGITMATDPEGEVLARGNHILKSYWNNPEASASARRDWFHTGDGGVIDDAGYLTLQDRKKDVIISGGENVSSIEVEDCLFSHPAVEEVAVIGVPDEKWGETAALVVVGGDADVTADPIDYRREDRPLQVSDLGRVPSGTRSHGHGQAPEVQAARSLLGGCREGHQLARRQGPGGGLNDVTDTVDVAGVGRDRTFVGVGTQPSFHHVGGRAFGTPPDGVGSGGGRGRRSRPAASPVRSARLGSARWGGTVVVRSSAPCRSPARM